ncbi:unnamed protein product [Nippostrongylus brasiliensis]|uniref:VWFA domain-containing protein n=1 Tax=Nippostrongylus brasiliensis TaxID=27835 RepID=A0A158QYN1_NIPBR|nr:unnamed protein product [Nippostrongylus brasiliensis]
MFYSDNDPENFLPMDDNDRLPCARLFLTIETSKIKDANQVTSTNLNCAVLYYTTQADGTEGWVRIGRTEVAWNTMKPQFTRKIQIDYFFDQHQRLKFEMYDIDKEYKDLSRQRLLGVTECLLAEIISVRSFQRPIIATNGSHCGTITISAEEAEELSVGDAEFHVRAEKLDRKDLFGAPDPFLKIYRILDDNGHQYIGECSISINGIIAKRNAPVPLINETRAKRGIHCCGGYMNSGMLHFLHFQIVKRYSFVEYIKAGTQLDFAVAIDLTASNGDPRKPTSLHYISDGERPSPYEMVISAIVDICQHYNRKEIFNAYGFGAIIPGTRKVSPVFNLNLSDDSEVQGLGGILNAYHSCVPLVRLYGPTNFAPVINEAARAIEFRDGSRYQILLIITDGAVCDMSSTKKAIIDASNLPMSIIIVGVGTEDFSSMNELVVDELRHDGRTVQRDIAQFIALRDLSHGHAAETALANAVREVLEKIPNQMTLYMEINGFVPMEKTAKRPGKMSALDMPSLESDFLPSNVPLQY